MGLGGDGPAAQELEWQFLQCFGERTPGEEVQEGELEPDGRGACGANAAQGAIGYSPRAAVSPEGLQVS